MDLFGFTGYLGIKYQEVSRVSIDVRGIQEHFRNFKGIWESSMGYRGLFRLASGRFWGTFFFLTNSLRAWSLWSDSPRTLLKPIWSLETALKRPAINLKSIWKPSESYLWKSTCNPCNLKKSSETLWIPWNVSKALVTSRQCLKPFVMSLNSLRNILKPSNFAISYWSVVVIMHD